MGSYVPSTQEQRQEMLQAIGLKEFKDLYKDVPQSMYLDRPLDLPEGQSELEVSRALNAMARKNRVYDAILRGAGAYDHYIPSIVKYIPAKEEFLTAYTPYQAEMSQGVLQSIFEYQTEICELTGMDVSNASVYDGATAAAEGCAMARDRKRRLTLISGAAHPDVINTVRTYCYGTNDEVKVIPVKDGKTDIEALKAMLTPEVSAVYVQQPNFYGLFEDAEAIAAPVHEAGALYILGVNPIALGIMKTPRPPGVRRPVSGLHGHHRQAHAQAPRPHRGRDHGRCREPGLRPVPPGSGAAHPPGEGWQQHLLQRGALRLDRRGLPGGHGARGLEGSGRKRHGQGPLSVPGAPAAPRREAPL